MLMQVEEDHRLLVQVGGGCAVVEGVVPHVVVEEEEQVCQAAPDCHHQTYPVLQNME